MALSNIRYLLFALLAAEQVLGHCGMTNFYVNGASQGDAVCVRMNPSLETFNNPVQDLTSNEMACGLNTAVVNRVCPVNDGDTMTFEFRGSANVPGGKVMDTSHLGPCSVYMKKVDSAINDTAYGDGWFKIWDEGYDTTANQWCTGKIISNGGLLTVDIPKGLVGGNYLIRPELLTLHNVVSMNQPQYYLGCGQIFLQSNGTLGPASTVAIPGHVKLGDPADSFSIYDQPLKLPYPMPGPPVATLQSTTAAGQKTQTEGARPANCILESGSNFCGLEAAAYTDAAGCQAAATDCNNQVSQCFKTAPPTGSTQCNALKDHCSAIQSSCSGGSGPPNAGKDLTPAKKSISPPAPLGPTAGGGTSGGTQTQTSAAAAAEAPSGTAVASGYSGGAGSATTAPPAAASAAGYGSYGGAASAGGGGMAVVTTVVYVTHYISPTLAARAEPTALRRRHHGLHRS